ncbi:MAG: glycosyltransferase [Anaerolineae bacterium]|nr:glycosyltransferase [Anaerolineae bacterium]MBT3712966.1 glycosyltransferase [Anaerolineae bacterium]MBT4309718.1 glycosyltransferase [Anaerolineae bacterium]MBT4456910.1 glycosyltransferase [Anaerolineae bacterium]MBT4841447.1 glycosyltransferase [Anaerolineae bacterium]
MRFIEVLYAISISLLAIYGYNSLYLAWLRVKRHKATPVKNFAKDDAYPYVTVQLPLFNERYVAERLIKTIGNLKYPRHRLHIQVLDDSTDETIKIVAQAVENERLKGLDIEHIQRLDRIGYKGGALEFGLASAKGDFLAIFDADFLPPPEFLEAIMPYYLDNPKVGCLQARWGHTNREASWLTRAQANGIDGHFIVEQEVRSANNFFLNFNGTAGVWRKSCIADAGGWNHDTLTEDLDLSYRAQLKGWKIKYIPHVIAPAELPVHINALKRQQFRWAKGSIQTAKKLLIDLWRSKNPTSKKIESTIHLTHYAVHPLMLFNLLITLPIISIRSTLVWLVPIFIFAAIGPMLMYWVAMKEEGETVWSRFYNLSMLLLLGMGLSLNNSLAVFEALLGKESAFLRTPKFNLQGKNISIKISEYVLPRDPFVWAEIFLALYTIGLLIYVLTLGVWSLVIWLILYASGYSYIAGLNFRNPHTV